MTTTLAARDIEPPQPTAETAHYWEAAAQDRLAIKRCDACQAAHHFPRALCPYCGSHRTRWEDASGRGVVYSYSVTRRGTPTPYVMAYVTLDEGVTMMTNIVTCDVDAVRVGDPVEVTFRAARDGQKVPMFKPRAADEGGAAEGHSGEQPT